MTTLGNADVLFEVRGCGNLWPLDALYTTNDARASTLSKSSTTSMALVVRILWLVPGAWPSI